MPERIVLCLMATEGLVKEHLVPYLAEDDQAEAERHRVPERALRLLAGRALARWSLAQHINSKDQGSDFGTSTGPTQPNRLKISRGRFSKPYMTGGPYFSSSGSPGLVACGISQEQRIGLDIENLERGNQLKMDDEALRQWTQRESVAKGVGDGVELAMDGLDISSLPKIRVLSSGNSWTTTCFAWRTTHIGSIALPVENLPPIEAYQVNLVGAPVCLRWPGFPGTS